MYLFAQGINQPCHTPALEKSKKKAAKAEAKAKRTEETRAGQRLQEEEHTVIQRQKEYLANMASTIMAEVQAKMDEYIATEAQRINENNMQTWNQGAVLESKRQMFPLILTNEGAKSVINEHVLQTKEKWVIHRKDIGRGHYSVIYQANDPLGRRVACKVTTLKPLPSNFRSRIFKSLGIQRFLKKHGHPNILAIHEIYLTQEKLYIVEDVMKTDLLKKIKNEAPLPEGTVLKIAEGVREGLAFLHSIEVAHEQLRPGHVLLDESGNAKTCGLGWASLFFDPEKGILIPQQGNKFHHFFAPEVMMNQPYDPSIADIWSFGTLLNIMLTKDWPFEQHNSYSRDIMWKMSFKKSRVELSDRVYSILSKCYAETPAERPDIFTILECLGSDIPTAD